MDRSEQNMVRDFHARWGFAIGEPFERPHGALGIEFAGLSGDLSKTAAGLLSIACHPNTPRGQALLAMRAHLIAEEFGEWAEACLDGDEISAIDALVDLTYVIKGTAVAYGWPLEAAFVEVHLSNLTKERQGDDVHKDRIRKKGPHWVAPQIDRIVKGKMTALRAMAAYCAFAHSDDYHEPLDMLKDPPSVSTIDSGCQAMLAKVPPATVTDIQNILKAFFGHERLVPPEYRDYSRGVALNSAEAGGVLGSEEA